MAEATKIVSVAKQLKTAIILTGDFNATAKNQEIKSIEKVLKRLGGNKPTWTVHPFDYRGWHETHLKYRLDNIFTSREIKSKNFKIIDNKVSDHLLIKTDILR